MAPGEQAGGGAVRRHGLVALVLRREGMPTPNPRGQKATLQRRGLAEVPPGRVKLAHAVVVARHGEPAHSFFRMLLHQLVRAQVQLVILTQLHGDNEVTRQRNQLERVPFQQLGHHVVAPLEVPAV